MRKSLEYDYLAVMQRRGCLDLQRMRVHIDSSTPCAWRTFLLSIRPFILLVAHCFLMLGLASCGSMRSSPIPITAASEREALSRLLVGRFDNFAQVSRERLLVESSARERIHSDISRVLAPSIGTHVFHIVQYLNGDPRQKYRERIYALDVQPRVEGVRMAIYRPKGPRDVSTENTSSTAVFDGSSYVRIVGCDVFWRRVDDSFRGSTEPGCSYFSSLTRDRIFVSDELILNSQSLSILEVAHDQTNVRLYGNPDMEPHLLMRASMYAITLVPVACRGDMGTSLALQPGTLRMHDQGDLVRLKGAGGIPTRYSLRVSRTAPPGSPLISALRIELRDAIEDAVVDSGILKDDDDSNCIAMSCIEISVQRDQSE
jgi:hypothetical protein